MEYNTHFLYPAALFASPHPYKISTILGSCVAVCLWDPMQKIGGINHFMLPLWNGQGLASPKYGNIAIERLIEKMIALGCRKNKLHAKIFGGAEVIGNHSGMFHIGLRNVAIAKETLEAEQILIISSSVGGRNGRKIIFDTYTGEVMHRFVQRSDI